MDVARLARGISQMVTRAVLSGINDAKGRQTVQAKLLENEVKDDVERIQQFGLSAHPPVGSEAVLLFFNGSRDHAVCIAAENRALRPVNLKSGEVVLYNGFGITLSLLDTGELRIVAPMKIRMETPLLEVTGNITATGDITAGNITLKTHHHAGVLIGSGTTGLPTP